MLKKYINYINAIFAILKKQKYNDSIKPDLIFCFINADIRLSLISPEILF